MLTVDFELLGMKNGELILDAGCGEGRHSFECIRRNANVFSMDIDMDSLRKTRYSLAAMRNKNYKEGRFQIHIGDALDLPFRDSTFDRIICAEMLEHVSDDNKACSELARVLKRGGSIAITIPTYCSELLFDMITHEYFTSPGGHIRKYLPRRITNLLKVNNLVIYGIKFKHSFHTIYWLIRSVVGLHLNDHPITKAYRSFLTRVFFSKFMNEVENFFDFFFPKSMILYAFKK